MKKPSTKLSAFALLAISLVAVFYPDIGNTSRLLTVQDGEAENQRRLDKKPDPPPGMAFSCPVGQSPFSVDWSQVSFSSKLPVQTVTLPTGLQITVSIRNVGNGFAVGWGKKDGYLMFGVNYTCAAEDIVDVKKKADYPDYPKGYSTMEFTFDRELQGLYISIGDVDSGGDADVVRIRMYDAAAKRVGVTMATTGTIALKNDFAFQTLANQGVDNPGFDASLYAKANGAVKTIALDQSMFYFFKSAVGKMTNRWVYPGLDFSYCSPTFPPTFAPTPSPTLPQTKPPTPVPILATSAPVPPTGAPIPPTLAPVPPTPAPVYPTLAPVPPTSFPYSSGVNGDPLIMGLSGQLFKFNGRSGAWYSAVSTKSFQWNLRTQEFENCPAESNTFISGVGINIMNRMIEVNVVNPYNVGVGCGSEAEQNCLGGGSLELIIDGVKHVSGGDYTFKDGSGRIVAFNTYHQCSRKWYDFDVRPSLELDGELRDGRRLDQPNVFEVLDGLKKTMIDPLNCELWINDRKQFNDLFQQPGLSSTILIETKDITLHLEYRQENERCDAHSIDVWISSVSPNLLDQPWEGIIGETKSNTVLPSTPQVMMDRKNVLRFHRDKDYEVSSPFGNKCKGCYHD